MHGGVLVVRVVHVVLVVLEFILDELEYLGCVRCHIDTTILHLINFL